MNKTLLVSSLAAAMGLSAAAEAAFTPLGDGVYRMEITGGCFDFGNCQTNGKGVLTDNTTANQATIGGFGSGIVGDGVMGVIQFTLTGSNYAVTSYSQDSYLNTTGGTFYLQDQDDNGLLMSGTIVLDAMTFSSTGRDGIAAAFATTLGLLEWNRDNTSDGKGTGNYTTFTTGISTNRAQGFASGFTITGSALQDSAVNVRTGTLVSAGNIGQAWGSFDNQQYSEIFDVRITLVSANPIANDDIAAGSVNTPIVINIAADLLANDTHADATENINFLSFIQPVDTLSSVAITGGGSTLTYTPNPALTAGIGVDSFDYTVQDDNGNPDTATVNITLAAGVPPVANNDAVATDEDTAVAFDPVAGAGAGIVADTDADAGQTATLTISAFDAVSVNNGTVTAAGNTLTYTPASNFEGPTDTINYTVIDTSGLFDSAVVTFNITSVNDAPVCSDVSFTTASDVPLQININNDLLITTGPTPLCVDVENDTLSLATFDTTSTSGGTIADDGAGNLTYTPPAGFLGEDSFAFTATDGVDNAAPNTVTINVADANLSNFTMLNADGNTFGGTNDVVFEWDGTSFNPITIDINGLGIPTDTDFTNMTIASPFPFFNFNWFAHHVRIFKNTSAAEITLNFDVTCTAADYDIGVVDCDKPLGDQQAMQRFISMTLKPGEIGGHILFDWGSPQSTYCGQNSCDIDVVNIWKENEVWANPDGDSSLLNDLWLGVAGIPPATDATWRLVSADADGDGINGSPMVDGAFPFFNANFNYDPSGVGTSLPPFEGEISDVEVDAFSMGLWSLLAGLLPFFGLRNIRNKK